MGTGKRSKEEPALPCASVPPKTRRGLVMLLTAAHTLASRQPGDLGVCTQVRTALTSYFGSRWRVSLGRLFCEAAYEAAEPQGNANRGVLVLRAHADGRRYVFTRARDVVGEGVSPL